MFGNATLLYNVARECTSCNTVATDGGSVAGHLSGYHEDWDYGDSRLGQVDTVLTCRQPG